MDLLVAERLIVEIKAVQALDPIHEAQMSSYLKLSGCRVGLLINFNVPLLSRGIKRLINGFEGEASGVKEDSRLAPATLPLSVS